MKTRKGLTLIEVIITIAIIGVIGMTLSGVFNTGLSNIVKAGDRTEDMFVLQKIMDESIKKIEEGESLETERTLDTGEKVLITSIDNPIDVGDHISNNIISGRLITVKFEKNTNRFLTTFVPIEKNQE